jgi:hypothetical protein
MITRRPTSDKGNDYHEHKCPNEQTDPSRQSCVAEQDSVRKTFEAKPVEASFAGRQGVDFDFIERECRKHYSRGHVADGEKDDFEYGNRESANHFRSPQAVSVVDSDKRSLTLSAYDRRKPRHGQFKSDNRGSKRANLS